MLLRLQAKIRRPIAARKLNNFYKTSSKIRACQGHSISVDVELTESIPPEVLYHGTSEKALDRIFEEGILPGTRLYVHLSGDIQSASIVGRRHGSPAIIKINAGKMSKAGIKFYLSRNDVWLTKFIPVEFLELVPNR